MSQGKIRFLCQKVCSVARLQTDRHTHTHTKVTTVGTLSGVREFFLQPIIKDRPNILDLNRVDDSEFSAKTVEPFKSLLKK